jgi:hypothetical protein
VGNTFTASQSADGTTWFTVATTTIPMAGTYYVGLAATSGDTKNNTLETSTFDNVTSVGTVNTPASTTLIPNGTYEITSLTSGLSFQNPATSRKRERCR